MINGQFYLILLITVLFFTEGSAYGQTYSTITYDAGTTINISSGADECADNIVVNGSFSGTGTICLGPLPVTLTSFTASTENNNITLMWVTEAELNNSGFDIERASVTQNVMGEWRKIAFMQGNGTTNQPTGYLYEDKKLNKGIYKYRLKQIDFNGNYEYFELANEIMIAPPNKFSVSQNYPNPSNPNSKIDYEIPVDGKVLLVVYDITGREVATLVNEVKEAGYYSAEFNGGSLASGVYFYRITTEGEGQKFFKTMKMIIVK